MSQVMNVVRCSGCLMHQVEMQKKAKRWQCKVCGAKQSLIQTFFQGTAKECRLQVQQLNMLQADLGNTFKKQSTSSAYFNYQKDHDSHRIEAQCSRYSLKRGRSRNTEQYANLEQSVSNNQILPKDEESQHSFIKRFKFSESQAMEDINESDATNNINRDILDDTLFEKSRKENEDKNSIFSDILMEDSEIEETQQTNNTAILSSRISVIASNDSFQNSNLLGNNAPLYRVPLFQSSSDIDLTLDF